MNKKGQVLVVFVLMIPLLIAFLGFVIDKSMIYYEQNKLKQIISEAANYGAKNKKISNESIIALIEKNENNITKLEVETNNVEVNIEAKIKIDSIFGKIIGFENYTIVERYSAIY